MGRLFVALCAGLVLVGCGGGGEPDAGSDALTGEERDVVDRGNRSSNASQQLSVVADSLFDFDPTLDASKTAAENALAIEARVRANLGSTDGGVPGDGGLTGCGSVSLSGTTVTVAYGPPPGCTLRTGGTISGTIAAGVAKSGSTITVSLTLTNVVANGVALSGTASFATGNGSTFTVNANVTSGSTTYTMTNLSVAGGTGTTTINGSVTVSGDTTVSMSFNAVSWKVGDCYPSGGTLTTKKGLVTTVVTFTAATATTGTVTVQVGRKTSTQQLPAYGSCGSTDGG